MTVGARALLLSSLAAALLAGCGADQPAAEAPRPVLVVQPGGAGEAVVEAFPGEVHAREEAALAFRVGGNLVRRRVDAGDRVHRGDLLAELDPGDLRLQAQATQAQLAAAEAELARTAADRKRYAALANDQLVSRSALDAQDAAYAAAAGQVRALRAQRDVAGNQAGYTQLRAPRDGVIANRLAEAGQVVAAGQTVFTLAADAGREVAIALPEAHIRAYAVGQPAVVEPWNQPGVRLPATVREIAPAADAQTRTYAARVALTGAAASRVDLGQSARVYLVGDGARGALRVPLAAVQRRADGGTAVWVVDAASGRVHLAPVQAGAFAEDSVPVRGLRADAWVVAAGGHLLREGERVAPVDRGNRPVAIGLPKAATAAAAR